MYVVLIIKINGLKKAINIIVYMEVKSSSMLNDINVVSIKSLMKPNTVHSEIPITQDLENFVDEKILGREN